jgi:catechol 2,3-dioxygenase-like lactoylglutathione lyase family enzyme
MHLEHSALHVDDYDTAIEFFVGALGFDLVEDSPSLTNDGRPKRWVVVVDDLDVAYQRMIDHDVEFVTEPQVEPYGTFAVFRDVAGNKWDLLGLDLRDGVTAS